MNEESGSLGVSLLKDYWSAVMASREGKSLDREGREQLDRVLLDGLGLGLQQTSIYLFQEAPSLSEFEQWIVDTAGRPSARTVARLNAIFAGQGGETLTEVDEMDDVFTPEDLLFWEENGYVILRNAVPEESRKAAEDLIWETVDAVPDEVESWYQGGRSSIMLEVIQHPALQANRVSKRIHKAFSQLWGTSDLWVTADRCGFHVPQREGFSFPGPDLHWDLDFNQTLKFGTQGILYLTDTPPEQGALTVVPGFHKKLDDWLGCLPSGADPQQQDLHALGSQPVGAGAGDMVIWHQFLPHGSRPNLGTRPRMVQYVNYYPGLLDL